MTLASPSLPSFTQLTRRRLVEIAELSWCPGAIRDGVTDYLQHVIDSTRPYDVAGPILRAVIDASPMQSRVLIPVVDMGSGGGGPWRTLAPGLGNDVQVTLTDAFPNVDAFARLERESHGQIRGERAPIRADALPDHLPGVRTMFSAFHHLAPADAVRVLRRATSAGHPIAVFEATQRSPVAMVLTLLTPLLVVLMTPAVRPFRWSRLFFTYVLPIIPLVVLLDGLVSCWRTYSPEELMALAHEAAPHGVAWRAGLLTGGPIPVTYLTGTLQKELA